VRCLQSRCLAMATVPAHLSQPPSVLPAPSMLAATSRPARAALQASPLARPGQQAALPAVSAVVNKQCLILILTGILYQAFFSVLHVHVFTHRVLLCHAQIACSACHVSEPAATEPKRCR
jgi:hypothetical protein